MRPVYIIGTGAFLPNAPVDNAAMSDFIGVVNKRRDDAMRRHILKQNGIEQRYYAVDKTGKRTHTNVEMCGQAMLQACETAGRNIGSVEFLSAGTTIGDMLVPAFATSVHGYLAGQPQGANIRSIHVHPTHGVCCASMHALEAANLFVGAGKYEDALVGAGERLSVLMQAAHFSEEFEQRERLKAKYDGYDFFEAEFLRYMLSDGAGALYISGRKPEGYALRIDWIESISYANALPTCMFMGDLEPDQYKPEGSWLAYGSVGSAAKSGLLNLRQKTDILKKYIIKQGLEFCQSLVDRGLLDLNSIDIIGAHISSYFFLDEIKKELASQNIDVPLGRFYSNLKTVGNIGCASPMIIVNDLFKKQMLKPGQKALLFVPESGRFAYSMAQLTAV